jgi:hypothetical protein
MQGKDVAQESCVRDSLHLRVKILAIPASRQWVQARECVSWAQFLREFPGILGNQAPILSHSRSKRSKISKQFWVTYTQFYWGAALN